MRWCVWRPRAAAAGWPTAARGSAIAAPSSQPTGARRGAERDSRAVTTRSRCAPSAVLVRCASAYVCKCEQDPLRSGDDPKRAPTRTDRGGDERPATTSGGATARDTLSLTRSPGCGCERRVGRSRSGDRRRRQRFGSPSFVRCRPFGLGRVGSSGSKSSGRPVLFHPVSHPPPRPRRVSQRAHTHADAHAKRHEEGEERREARRQRGCAYDSFACERNVYGR